MSSVYKWAATNGHDQGMSRRHAVPANSFESALQPPRSSALREAWRHDTLWRMSAGVRAVFGLPAYNHAHRLAEALDSLLHQTRGDFRIIISDDCSTDGTAELLEAYADRDGRIIHRRNPQRLGYIGNARRCFDLARELFPDAPDFAWASDHDIWHPEWLDRMTSALDQYPEAVVACCWVKHMDDNGEVVRHTSAVATTVATSRRLRRFVQTFRQIVAGNMVYGLMRAEAIQAVGGLQRQLMPDRLLLVDLSLHGTMVTVPEYLWWRRYVGLGTMARQRRASFPNGVPLAAWLPWPMTHAWRLLETLAMRPRPAAPVGRASGSGYALLYLVLGMPRFAFGVLHGWLGRFVPTMVRDRWRRRHG